jgi:hypothetical protein
MGVAIQEATPIVLTAEGRITVEGWVRSSKAERRLVERARVVLLAAAVEFPDFINQVVAGCPDQGDSCRPGQPLDPQAKRGRWLTLHVVGGIS